MILSDMTPEMELAQIDTRLEALGEQEKEYFDAGQKLILGGDEYGRSLYKPGATLEEKKEIRAREKAGEGIRQLGYSYRERGFAVRREIEQLEEKRKKVYKNTAAGIKAAKEEQLKPVRPFINGFGQATHRYITTTTYERAQKRLDKQLFSFLGR